jgi:hypothetical protein
MIRISSERVACGSTERTCLEMLPTDLKRSIAGPIEAI